MSEPIRVLLVDDQPLLRMGFSLILEATDDIEVVGEASNGAEALELTGKLKPHVVLMDVRMPLMDGITATQRICAKTCAKVIILTTFDLDEYAFSGLRAGASAFLLKDVEPDELTRAVRIVHAGESIVAPRITSKLVQEYVLQTNLAPSSALETLSPREEEVMRVIAEGLSNAEIAQRLFISETTVKTHVRSILMKCGLRDRVQIVVFAYENGIVRPGAKTIVK